LELRRAAVDEAAQVAERLRAAAAMIFEGRRAGR
jgi:hypothetical protein